MHLAPTIIRRALEDQDLEKLAKFRNHGLARLDIIPYPDLDVRIKRQLHVNA